MTQSQFVNLSNLRFPLISYSLEKVIPENFIHIPYEPYVRFSDEVVEFNFRVIETFLPEIIFLMASENQSIMGGIIKLSRLKFYRDTKFSKRVLVNKMCYFIEALLYSDLFSGVWKGDIINNRVYVEKHFDELEYYSIFEMRKLVVKMLKKLTIRCKDSTLQIKLFNQNS